MGRIAVSCGSQKGWLHFYVRSPVEHLQKLPKTGLELSEDVTAAEWLRLSGDGHEMVTRLRALLTGRSDYVKCFRRHIEIVQTEARWRKTFASVVAVLGEWECGGKPELFVAPDCPSEKRAWVQSLIDSVA